MITSTSTAWKQEQALEDLPESRLEWLRLAAWCKRWFPDPLMIASPHFHPLHTRVGQAQGSTSKKNTRLRRDAQLTLRLFFLHRLAVLRSGNRPTMD